jgi:hypothetical protein
MIRHFSILSLILGVFLCAFAHGADDPRIIAAGDWSKPVADNLGATVRGRLVIYEGRRDGALRETPVYVELQDASEARGRTLHIFCDMGRRDFSGKTKSGLKCEMHDKDRKLIESASFPFGGGVPASQWITLPSDSTIRLRATPYGIRRENALAICPHLGALWLIADDDRKEYILSATFGVSPSEPEAKSRDGHVWRGTLVLPPVRIVNAGRTHAAGAKAMPGEDRRPSLSLADAINSAEEYAKSEKINLSECVFTSARLVFKAEAKGKYVWELVWDKELQSVDDEVELIVDMDKSVTRRFRG